MFLYVRTATSEEQSLRKKDLLHFIPFCLCFAYYLPLYLQSRQQKLDYINAALQNYPPLEWRIRSGLLVLQSLPYVVLTVAMFRAHNRRTKASPSAAGRSHMLWLRIFIVMILTTAAVGLLRFVFTFRAETMLLVPLCFSIMVYVAGYMTLKHPDALTGGDESTPSKKYGKSNLTSERAEAYLKRLLHVMKTERPYIDGDLTLQKLADRLSIPVNHLSQIINERVGQNFFDFVNSYRVKEAQELLIDAAKKHYTVLAIAEEVGFSSKSAFNAVFKKHVNMTPSEYRRNGSTKE
jgi:AraC-like DNA-binding protein